LSFFLKIQTYHSLAEFLMEEQMHTTSTNPTTTTTMASDKWNNVS
jgi:hypothetical protein